MMSQVSYSLRQIFEIVSRRITKKQIVTWPVLIGIALIHTVTTFAYSGHKLNASVDSILFGLLVSNLFLVLAGRFYRGKGPLLIHKNLFLPWVMVFALGVIREFIFSVVVTLTGSSKFEMHIGSLLFNGLILTYIAFVYTAIAGAKGEYVELLAKYELSKLELADFRNRAAQTVAIENEDARSQTLNRLLPTIEKLQQLLKSTSASKSLVDAIRNALVKDVRPLGQELQKVVNTGEIAGVEQSYVLPRLTSVPKRFSPREYFNPNLAVLFFSPILLAGEVSMEGLGSLGFALQQILTSYMILTVFRVLLPKQELLARRSFILIIAVASLADLVTVIINYPHPFGSVLYWQEYFQTAGLTPFWFAGLAYLLIVQTNLQIVHAESTNVAEQFEKERALFQQRIWNARRNWSYIVHGTIQSCLNAAMMRANSPKLTRNLKAEIDSDLQRALLALNNLPKPNADLKAEFSDLKETWRGLATLEFEISKNADRSLKQNGDLRFSVNEIVKEAVSNAIRHGSCTKVAVKIDCRDGLLQIRVRNKAESKISQSPKSLGSKMLDELAYSWSLTQNGKSKEVLLRADLVVA